MGEVFAAENVRTGRHVAIKLLRADSKTKASSVERFRREARAAGSINSDHVTQVLDVEEDSEHGIVLVFELLEGESLIDRLKRTGPIPFEELYGFIEQVWLGLADAHRVGIIHRDLKPSNVFLERRPDGQMRVKILDFGISKLPKEMGGETITEMGQSLGTFSFMPPEQIGKAKTVDHRADIYACATLIYQALSGQLPYSARNILVMVELKNKTDPRTLGEVMDRPVDPRLEAFVRRGLARDPANRFQSAIEALAAWRELRPNVGTPYSSAPQTPQGLSSTPIPPAAQAAPRSGPAPQSGPAISQPMHGAYGAHAAAPPGSHHQSYPPQSPAQGGVDRRPRGGTLAMENSYESTAPTKPMQAIQAPPQSAQADSGRMRPASQPPVSPQNAQWSGMPEPARMAVMAGAGASPYQDPRSAQGPYHQGSYPPPPLAHNAYNAQGYAQQQMPQQAQHQVPQQAPHQGLQQNPYDENNRLAPPTQTTTRVYNPNNPMAYQQPGMAPNSSPHSGPTPSSGQAAMQAPMPAAPPGSGSSVRVVLWFVGFAVVGFGIVAALHYFSVF